MPALNRRVLAAAGCLMAGLAVALLIKGPDSTSAPIAKNEPAGAVPETAFVVGPYLQFPTRESIVVMWETRQPGTSVVEYGDKLPLSEKITDAKAGTMHEVAIRGLKPNSTYLYRVSSVDAEGKARASDVLQFRTAVDEDSAFSFALIGDTQKNPAMTGQIATLIWDRRPHFVVHLGDVVDNGPDKKEWVNELFGPCQMLFSRVPVFPTIGNHERNHAHYYQYFSLPAPKYYYRYAYGNADFFVVDSNKSLKPESEQFKWLDRELGQSKAKWKFVYHHHPLWTSDADDYGDTTKNVARFGDLNARNLSALYEKHHVDMEMNGHIHMYERTWPIRDGKVSPKDGVVYITSGGGGGKLEEPGPLPAWFKAQLRVDFHFCYVNIQGGNLEFKAFDQKGNLFDFLEIRK